MKEQRMKEKLMRLNTLNWIAGGLHFVQGVAILLLSRDFTVPLGTDHLIFNERTQMLEVAQSQAFTLNLPWLIAIFFFISAAAHWLIASVYRGTYEKNLKQGINKARWYEYAMSASIMIVAIMLLVGVRDVSILFLAFVATAVMNLLGLVMEQHNSQRTDVNWSSYIISTISGLAPWLVIIFYFWASGHYANAEPPTFVYFIFVSIFIFFSSFAVNMWLQYKQVGKWQDYLYGEKAYIVLSFVAKSALAWQVFAGTLQP